MYRYAAKEGKDERASGEGSIAASEKDISKQNQKAEKDTKAPGLQLA
jgi:hypothetical protein